MGNQTGRVGLPTKNKGSLDDKELVNVDDHQVRKTKLKEKRGVEGRRKTKISDNVNEKLPGKRTKDGGNNNTKKGVRNGGGDKFDAISECEISDAKECEISMRNKISSVRRCKLNVPPFSKIPEPEYKIRLLIEEKYEGPFRLILRKSPCILELTSIDGLTLRSIRKSDIIFVQALKSEVLRLFIKDRLEEENDSEQRNNDKKRSKSDTGTIMIVLKFTKSEDCESFEFFFPFIYGIIVHSDRIKIPIADYIEFGDYIIGSNKNVLERMNEYKEISKGNYKSCVDDDDDEEMDDNRLLNLYEEKMIQQEREFFTRKNLVINYIDDSFLNFEGLSEDKINDVDAENNEKMEKEKIEKYSKLFPISISGQSESGEIITFNDISPIGVKYRAEVIEWRLSVNIGGSKCLFFESPVSVSRTFQINDDHIGRYIQARVYRHIGQDLSEIFVYSQTQSNIIIPGDDLLFKVAELIIKGKLYRVEIPTYDVFRLLSVYNPQYYIEMTRYLNPNDDYSRNPVITCLLDIKYSNIQLLIPTPTILSNYYECSKFIPLCFGYDEFIFTRKADWYGYNLYPNIYESIYKQGELLSKVSLIMSFIDKERKDISLFFSTEVEKKVVYNAILFRQITPNISISEVNREYNQKKFVNFKKKFIYGFKKTDWKSRLVLKDAQIAGTYIKKNIKMSNNIDLDNISIE